MVLSMDRWVGKVAVVTGASSGIGASITEALVGQGLKVVGLARRLDRLEALSQKLSNKKGKLYPVKTDISKEEDILNAFKWIKENLGPVHILINNAGVMKLDILHEGNTETWKNIFKVNVIGLCIATREAVKDMKANNVDGHIIHINAVVGHQVPKFLGMGTYPSSKFAVRALAETLRLELMNLKLKIKITDLSPGPVLTELNAEHRNNENMTKLFKNALEQKKIIEPDNISDAVIYALSTPPHVQVQELIVTAVDATLGDDIAKAHH